MPDPAPRGYNLRNRKSQAEPQVPSATNLDPAVLPLKPGTEVKVANGHSNGKEAIAPPRTSSLGKKGEFNPDADKHEEYEFGGPIGTSVMLVFFPCMMYYLYICLWFYDGKFIGPDTWSFEGVKALVEKFGSIACENASPTPRAFAIYMGLMVYQFVLAYIMPGVQQEGVPVPSLNGATLMYHCNALASWYTTLITAAGLHLSGIFRLTELIDSFGSIMTVAIIWGFTLAALYYVSTVVRGRGLRMSGNPIYDYFMGAVLNPRIGHVDVKMFAEVRIPWVLLFLISVGGACKQYEELGYLTPNSAFMVLASGLYINACAKGEECIPQTWDMSYEKWGWLLSFWNFAGVPFTYCYSIVYIATHDPSYYTFPLWGNVLLYATLLSAYYIFDTSMSQKSRFKMQEQFGGSMTMRNSFPQLPWGTVKEPKFILTSRGSKLLVDGWWAYARKPNYAADFVQSMTWGLCAGFKSPIPYFYPFFFFCMIVHRCGRDFERCARKYGKDWDEYCRIVPYKFIPGIY